MLLSNLREPDWISISCHEKLLAFTFCRIEDTNKSKYNISKYKSSSVCKSHHILVNNKCYGFLWNEFQTITGDVCNNFQARRISMNEFTSFYHIFDAVSSVNIFPTFVFQNMQKVSIIHIHKLFNQVKFTAIHQENVTVAGYVICNFKKIRILKGINIFKCSRGGFILHRYICDGITDCPRDKSDEEFCICDGNKVVTKNNNLCMKLNFNKSATQCNFNYYMKINGVCEKYESNVFTKQIQTKSSIEIPNLIQFSGHSGQPVTVSLVNDLVSEYGPQFEDESALMTNVKKVRTFLCRPQEIPCMEGYLKCFNITDICLYQLNTDHYLIPCRNGGHLENCAKFECNMVFKCLDSYCIPWKYVCDGKWDCPNGDDEQKSYICMHISKCQAMFKCKGEHHTCISFGQVCDNRLDCLYHDDEMFCELKLIQCPSSCNCLIFAITCVRLLLNNLQFNSFGLYLSVYITESNFSSLNILDHKLQHVHVLHLPKNNLHSICPLLFLRSLLLINLELNFITEIKGKCLSNSLEQMSINNNHIIYLHIYAFHNLHHLIFLNLSNNPIINLPPNSFSNLFSLKSLNLQDIFFEIIDPKAFISTSVKLIKNIDHKITCVIQTQTYCTTYPPWYVSCFDIIPHRFLKNLFVSVSILVICLNILSIFGKIFKFHGSQINQTFKIKEIGLNLCGVLCGLYLAIIWLSDNLLKHVYLVNEKLWQSHPLCYVEFCVALWFTISSQIILLYISMFRLKVVTYPMKARQIAQELVFFQISMIHIFSVFISLVITLIFKFMEMHVATSLCLPFVDPSGLSILTKIISWVTIMSQSISSVMIVIMHVKLIREVHKVKRSIQIAKSSDDSNKSMVFQLMFTSASNILCWIPSNAIYLSAMFLPSYPLDLILWTVVIIIPINSVSNPVVFIVTVLKVMFKV